MGMRKREINYFYTFLNDFDYLRLLSYYETTRNNEKDINLKENIIKRLKNSKYKINSSRKSKMRKK